MTGEIASAVTKPPPQDKLTLGAFLEVLDGIIELPGRVIIITTNQRRLLDRAITRPGRIDLEIEFKKLRKIDIAKIFKEWSGREISKEMYSRIKDYKYSQCQISQLMFENFDNPDGFLTAVTQPVSYPLLN